MTTLDNLTIEPYEIEDLSVTDKIIALSYKLSTFEY